MNQSPFRTAAERQAEREHKREAVLRAAVAMFNRRGFHTTSLDDVAASLGVSKPTIYHYLGNKDQVLLECVIRGVEQVRAAADSAAAVQGTGYDRLAEFLRRYAEIVMDDFGRCMIRTNDEQLCEDSSLRFRALKRDVDRAMQALIAEGIADGSIAPTDVKLAGYALAGALSWPARWHKADGRLTREETAAQMVDILMRGLAPR